MFMLKDAAATEAVATESNCNANDCNHWLPTSWCYGEDAHINHQGDGLNNPDY